MNKKKLLTDLLLMSIVALFMRTVGVAFNSYVSREAGAEAMGLYGLIMSVYTLSVTFATSGINLGVTRMVSEALSRAENGRPVLRICLLYALVFGGTASFLLFFFAPFVGKALLSDIRTVVSLRAFALSLLPIAFSSVLDGYFTAVRRVYKSAAKALCEQALRIICGILFLSLFLPKGAEFAALSIILGGAVAETSSCIFAFIMYAFEKNKGRLSEKNNGFTGCKGCVGGKESGFTGCKGSVGGKGNGFTGCKGSVGGKENGFTGCKGSVGGKVNGFTGCKGSVGSISELLSITLPASFSAYFRSALLTVEHILVPRSLERSGLSHTAALSSYGVLHGMAMPIVLFPHAITTSYGNLLLPEAAAAKAAGDKKRVADITASAIKNTLRYSVFASVMLLSLSSMLGEVIYASKAAGEYIRIVAAVVPIMYLDTVSDCLLKGIGEQFYSMCVNIGDSLFSVFCVYFLVSKGGITAYAIIIVIAEVLNFSFSFLRLIVKTEVKINIFGTLFLPLILSVASSFLSRSLIGFLPLYRVGYIVFYVLSSAFIYFLALFLLRKRKSCCKKAGKVVLYKEA